ncbi:MAG: MoaD/ThiS family protein [Methanosarcinales archaeon]|nr:MoaD/ThiS family protein [Methanosarcinales archaeon]
MDIAIKSKAINLRTINVKIFAGSASSTNVDINDTTTYLDILDKLDINPETVIVMANGLPHPLDETPDCDNIEILRVVSGG